MTTAALVLGALDAVLAVAVVTVGALGITRRLPRNRVVGIRTPLTLRSDDAFRAAHAVAGPGFLGAGLVAALGAVFGLAGGSVIGVVFSAIALVAALLVVGAAASFGLRAAARVPEVDEGSSCGTGGCGSCVLAGACGTADSAV
ncbi:SdpI family protein [Williamsia deligens]|uniref:SdpI family protein n=1 Tax=Williamsia deligens TaxID=321325 RepID=A0ABW3G4T7_9NOCA|nr:SdpI family protein [Williamsia deligens]MCP2193784.1 SdpI/YhfL protein family protein [Williamsia deligens]